MAARLAGSADGDVSTSAAPLDNDAAAERLHELVLEGGAASSTASEYARDAVDEDGALETLLAAISASPSGDGALEQAGVVSAVGSDRGGVSGAASLMRSLSAALSVASVSATSPSGSQLQRSQPTEPPSAGSGATFVGVRETGSIALEEFRAAQRGRGTVLSVEVMTAPVGHERVVIPAIDATLRGEEGPWGLITKGW